MAAIDFNSSAADQALNKMTSAAENLNQYSKDYISALENDVFANLSGTSVQNFMNKTQTQCNNLANEARNLSEIARTLTKLKNKIANESETISRM